MNVRSDCAHFISLARTLGPFLPILRPLPLTYRLYLSASSFLLLCLCFPLCLSSSLVPAVPFARIKPSSSRLFYPPFCLALSSLLSPTLHLLFLSPHARRCSFFALYYLFISYISCPYHTSSLAYFLLFSLGAPLRQERLYIRLCRVHLHVGTHRKVRWRASNNTVLSRERGQGPEHPRCKRTTRA